jgi:hypothetical protein
MKKIFTAFPLLLSFSAMAAPAKDFTQEVIAQKLMAEISANIQTAAALAAAQAEIEELKAQIKALTPPAPETK